MAAVARNPNANPELLLKMLRSPSAGERVAAVQSGKLPPKAKMDYLVKGCALNDDYETSAVAKDTDTPVEIQECLAEKPGAAVELA